jgi:hypothetical protein
VKPPFRALAWTASRNCWRPRSLNTKSRDARQEARVGALVLDDVLALVREAEGLSPTRRRLAFREAEIRLQRARLDDEQMRTLRLELERLAREGSRPA